MGTVIYYNFRRGELKGIFNSMLEFFFEIVGGFLIICEEITNIFFGEENEK
jgi:hypothetical protein